MKSIKRLLLMSSVVTMIVFGALQVHAREYIYTAYSGLRSFSTLIYQASCKYNNYGQYKGDPSIYKYSGDGSVSYVTHSVDNNGCYVLGHAITEEKDGYVGVVVHPEY